MVLVSKNSQLKTRNILISVDFTNISHVNCLEIQIPTLRETLQVLIRILPSKFIDKTSLHFNLILSKALHFRLGSMSVNVMSMLSQLSKFGLPYVRGCKHWGTIHFITCLISLEALQNAIVFAAREN